MTAPEVFEVTHALHLIRQKAELPQGQFQLLAYVVEQTLAGKAADINQKTIAADVFGRDLATFDGHTYSIVRTTASKLRQSLMKHYERRGQSEPIVIEIPAGSYIPRFARRPQLSSAAISRLWSARMALETRTVSGFKTALKGLDAVLSESPGLSLALALKSEALASQAIHGARPRPVLEQARELANRATDQPRVAWQAWLAQGIVHQALDFDWEKAEKFYRQALEASSNEAAHHVWHTAFLVGRGRLNEAVSHLEACVDRYGYTNPTCVGDLSMMLMLARKYDAARAAIDAAIEASPNYYQHHLNRAILLEAQGDAHGAVRVLDHMPLRVYERPVTWGLRALFAGLGGSPEVAHRRIRWLRAVEKTGKYVPPNQFAACWLGAGDHDEAVHFLEMAAQDRDPLTVWFYAYPFFRHLSGHPGFEDLINRLGLVRYLNARGK